MINNDVQLNPEGILAHYKDRIRVAVDVYVQLADTLASPAILNRAKQSVWRYETLIDVWRHVVRMNKMTGDGID